MASYSDPRGTTGVAPKAPAPVIAPTAPVAAVRKDAYGNIVPDPATDPEGYAKWHAANIAAQTSDTSGRLAMEGVNKLGSTAIQGDISNAGLNAKAGYQTAIAGIDTSGQLNPGTTRAPTVAESLAKYGPQATPSAFPGAAALSSVSRQNATSNQQPFDPRMDMGGGVISNPSKVGTAADQATDALGPAPTVDQGLADRRLGDYQEALGMSREVIDRLLNGPSTADRIGSQTLRSQLALARSAAGGPGAVQEAMRNAQFSAPELEAQAAQQASAEELQRVTAAGNVASNFAQASLGARGQDVQIAQANQNAGVAVKGMITQLTGTQLELDQRNSELLGQMARDMAAMDFDWAQLSVQQQQAALDRYLQQYGVDQNIAAQIKLANKSGKMSLKDWVNAGVGVLGAAAGIGAAAAGKK